MISAEAAGALAVLALTDSLSFGTLLVPVWLLMTPGRVRPHRILIYLGTVAAIYYGIGIVLMAGGRFVIDGAAGLLDTTAATIARLVVGAALLAASFALDTKAARARAAERAQQSGRLGRWRERAMSDSATSRLAGLAVAAVLLEVASMLPYLVATGIIADQTPGWPTALLVLTGYCLVMVAPALALTAGRLVARSAVEVPLKQLDTWLTRNARSTTLWIVGIAGFFLAATALQDLGWVPR
ncbi:GAP family protein (plasmid) [Prescottella equi]|uniref:GAP family protein n=1 Tax=Rhodococcus hoagii TaxID=43767 RepID=UPI002574CAEC|nr:GAP family protein [Prescottella equi]WJJ14578.1 GAP family protein [Prescottella equi]